MRIKCISGSFTGEEIWVEIIDAEQESAGEIVTPNQYVWVEKNYPGALKTVESKLFYVEGYEGGRFFYIEEKHPLFNIDLVSEILDTGKPKEELRYKAVVNLLRPFLS